ncbi:hypothetical protein OHS58_18035 [Amycolatopsis sp. NBC_00348]|uniref:hypothetical protein n=1 Tax=Amycolatopsis sp. NBC_00348 TaxID=2975956 RepID=UPI002E2728A6
MDDDEAVTELMTARLLSFNSQGFMGNFDSSTVAYQHVQDLGVRALPLLERVLEEGTPAGRAYAATLVGQLDDQAGRTAWERLAGEAGRVRYSLGCVGYELSLGEYARSCLDGHPGSVNDKPAARDLSTWTIDRLEHYVATLADGRELDRARRVAREHACRPGASGGGVRRRWAKLASAADVGLPGDNSWDLERRAQLGFCLRMWIIEQFGPDGDPDWDPEALAADTLAALTLDADQAIAMATNWRDLPREQIRDLHRHRALTCHVDRLVGHLQAGPVRERLIGWVGFGRHLR